jgi:hypothetical protein
MKLSFLTSSEINRDIWDRQLLQCSNALPYAATWYLDAVFGDTWSALICGNYDYLIPLPMKKKWGISYLPTPLFVQQLGIFGAQPVSDALTLNVIRQIENNFKWTDFNFNFGNLPVEEEGKSWKHRCNLILPLPADRSTLAAGYSENLRRNIQKAKAAGLYFGTGSIRTIINLFVSNKEAEIANWNPENYAVLERLYHMASLRGCARSFGMYSSEGNMLAGAVFIEWNGRSIFLFSGNSAQGKQLGAMPALINTYLQELPASYSVFDFEGSDNLGLKRFYQSFGAIESNYVNLKINRLPFYLRWLKA